VQLKQCWRTLTGRWLPHDTRDEVVDFVRERAASLLPGSPLRLKPTSTTPWSHAITGIEAVERAGTLAFGAKNPLEGYRRMTFMMLDQDVAAVSPSTTYCVPAAAGVIDRWNRAASKKGAGFDRRCDRTSIGTWTSPT